MAFIFRRSEYVGIAMGAASGSLIFAALPFVVGAAVTAFGNPADAGMAAAGELLAMGIGSIGIGAALSKLPCRQTCLVAALALIIAHGLSAFAIMEKSWTLFIAARMFAGLSEGFLYTICNTMAAKAPRPDRAFTIIAFGQTIFAALFFSTMAVVNSHYDPAKVFLLFAGFTALALPLSVLAPKLRATEDLEAQGSIGKVRFEPIVKRLLIGFVIYSVALFVLFPYVENIGTTNGFTHSQVASILAVSTLAALLGPPINAAIGLRLGWTAPLMVAIAFQIIAALVLVHVTDIVIWGGAELTSIVLLYVLSPMMYGLVAHIEPTGRAAAIATAIMSICAALGPAISSFVLNITGSYVALGWFNAGIYVLMALVVIGPSLYADRRMTSRSAGAKEEGLPSSYGMDGAA